MKNSLIIPVENQVREFDPKLLLACIAARRGFSAIIGSRWEIDNRIASFPRSVYLSKSMTARGGKMLKIMRKIGHEVVAWDEEALVHLPPETFFSRRISPTGIKHVSHLFAWGQDNAELWRQYPSLSTDTPIHITGNPRGDMLRPEMRDFYAKEIRELREIYGNFILINTNFNHVNAFYPHQNLFMPVRRSGEEPRFGKAARGMSREFAEGLRAHKQALFNDFKNLISPLSKAFPDLTLVVRPHPTESHEDYRKIASACGHASVTNEGNVVPWLLAAKLLVHNGCTTGVEAFAMGVPAITYRKSANEYYDNEFYRLPNSLSHQCFNFEELRLTVEKILAGELSGPVDEKQQVILGQYLTAQDGALACERIVDVLEKMTNGRPEFPKPDLLDRFEGWSVANGRRLVKGLLSYLPNTHNRPEFQRHRFPGISLDALNNKIERIQRVLGDTAKLKVEQLSDVLFRISPGTVESIPGIFAERRRNGCRGEHDCEKENMKNLTKIRNAKACLIIPVENQVRELDPKLLLACIAARHGFAVIIGSHREIDLRIASLPRGLYLNKSMTDRNLKMFRIMHNLGHEIVTWDEEALVHLPAETYYSRRLSPTAIRYNSHLFAWGEDNAELWRRYPDLPPDMPIHITGNPRSDMLRTDLRRFYESEAENFRRQYGRFILVNTNFNHVNAFYPAQNLFLPAKKAGETPRFGKAAVGMNRGYAEGLRDHKQAILDAFKQMIPMLDRAYPDHTIIVRPHPTENPKIYHELAAGCKRVNVTNEGNVVPWLMATDAVIHNGCTTGVEAYVMGVPAISFRPKINEEYDLGFYRLPNLISHQCYDPDQLQEILSRILTGELGAANGEDRRELLKKYLVDHDGPLACERIVDILESILADRPALTKPALNQRLLGWSSASWRRFNRYARKHLPGKHAPEKFHRHRWPNVSLKDLNMKIARLQAIIGDSPKISTANISDQIFVVEPCRNMEV